MLRNVSLEPAMEADFKRLPALLEQVKTARAANQTPPKKDDPPPALTQLSLF